MDATLLVELLTEELPPRSVSKLCSALGSSLYTDLRSDGFLGEARAIRLFATPRRLRGLVRPHGANVVPGKVLGLESGNRTRGHRFMSSGEIVVGSADAYETTLLGKGKVVAGFPERRTMIEAALK